MKKYFFIMRGIPGSGKTPLAKQIAGNEGKVYSFEDFLENPAEKYQLLEAAQAKLVEEKIFEAVSEEIISGTSIIILDRTNLREWNYKKYSQKAQQAGYAVVKVIMPRISAQEAFDAIGGKIPIEILQKMVNIRDRKMIKKKKNSNTP